VPDFGHVFCDYFELQESDFLAALFYFTGGYAFMSLINISNLTFAYDGSYDNIFENVSFQLDTDWKLGFTGRNGRGKTTFLNLLLGKYQYSGTISSGVAFERFPFDVPDKSLTTSEILSGVAPDSQAWEILRELNMLDVKEDVLDRPFQTLSSGEQTKVLLAALFIKENSFLLIDEPTNHLDMTARDIVGRYLNTKKGFILVSHDRAFLDTCTDHILSINKASIDIQKGNFSTWWQNKQLQDNFELAENDRLKKDIRHLEEATKRTAAWSDKAESRKIGFDPKKTEKSTGRRPLEGAKAKKMMSRSKAIQERQQAAIDEKSGLLKNIETSEPLKISPLQYHTSRLLTLEDVRVLYDGKPVCGPVSFAVAQGDRIALCGKNGSGKSSILKLICEDSVSYQGTFHKGSRLILSHIPQDTAGLCGSLTEYAASYGIDESLFKAILRKLDFARVQFEKDIENLSEGQKKKVLIARSLCEKAHLYIWDEPLNYIDVLSRMQIEDLLREYKPTILFVEHDRSFCDSIATKTVVI
jgi:lincosamide and streptogramin A transport system ATP-binding/permease protein